LDVDRGSDNPRGYVLPLDEVSPLYGKSWRQIGIDAFANHHTQGIAGFLNSPFLRRPIALSREDGEPFEPASLAATLAAAAGKKGPCGCDEQMKLADKDLESARQSALQLNWPSTVVALLGRKTDRQSLIAFVPYPVPDAEQLTCLHREREK
jgi:hypothetical protein